MLNSVTVKDLKLAIKKKVNDMEGWDIASFLVMLLELVHFNLNFISQMVAKCFMPRIFVIVLDFQGTCMGKLLPFI